MKRVSFEARHLSHMWLLAAKDALLTVKGTKFRFQPSRPWRGRGESAQVAKKARWDTSRI